MGNKHPVFNGLPKDVVRILLMNVDPFIVRLLPRVCKQFYAITQERSFYPLKLKRDYPTFIVNCDPKECYLCLSIFFNRYKALKEFLCSEKTKTFLIRLFISKIFENIIVNLGFYIDVEISWKSDAIKKDDYRDKHIRYVKYNIEKASMTINEKNLKNIKYSLRPTNHDEKFKKTKLLLKSVDSFDPYRRYRR